MKNTRKNRIQAFLIAIVMVIGVLPVAASAAPGGNFFTLAGSNFKSDITELTTFEFLSGDTIVHDITEMDPNVPSAVLITAENADNKFSPNSNGEMIVTVPSNIKISKVNAEKCESEDVTCYYYASTNQLSFQWKTDAKDHFSATIPIELNAPSTRNDVSGTWVVAVKNKNSQLIVIQPSEKTIDGANRLTATEGILNNHLIYKMGAELPEWKVTRYTGDWYSISYGGQYLNFGSDGGNIRLSGTPQYFLYTTVPTGDQFMAVGSDGNRYYLNNKANNASKGIQASTYDDQCVELYHQLKSTDEGISVKFSANGGNNSNGLNPVFIQRGTSMTLPGYNGSRDGYTFIGWATSGNIRTNTYVPIYQPGATVQIDDEVTFYATWSPNNPEKAQFGIRMSGDIPDEPSQHDPGLYSKQHVYIENTVIKGTWVVDTNAAGKAVEGNHVVNAVTANLKQLPSDDDIKTMYPDYDPATMYVHWYVLKFSGGMWKVDGVVLTRSHKVDVRYDANVATENKSKIKNIPASYKVDDGTGIIIGTGADGKKTNPPEYPEHIFEGWNTKEDGSGQAYESGMAYTANEDVTFYAQWTKIPSYQVTYITGEEERKEYHAGDKVILPEATDKDDCIFAGWFRNGERITGSEFIMPEENVEIKSVYYGPIDVDIISDWNGGNYGTKGTEITLTAIPSVMGDVNLDYAYQWQYQKDGIWVDVEGATEVNMTFGLNEETAKRIWRVIITDAWLHQD